MTTPDQSLSSTAAVPAPPASPRSRAELHLRLLLHRPADRTHWEVCADRI